MKYWILKCTTCSYATELLSFVSLPFLYNLVEFLRLIYYETARAEAVCWSNLDSCY